MLFALAGALLGFIAAGALAQDGYDKKAIELSLAVSKAMRDSDFEEAAKKLVELRKIRKPVEGQYDDGTVNRIMTGLNKKAAGLLDRRDYPKVRALCDLGLKVLPEDGDLLVVRGKAEMGLKMFKDAAASFSTALEMDSGNLSARGGLIMAQACLGEYEKAMFGVDMLPSYARKKYESYVLITEGKYDEAQECLFAYLEDEPNEYDARILMGDYYQGLWDFDKAEEQYEMARRLEPMNPEYYNRMASMRTNDESELYDLASAIKMASKAIELDHYNPEHYVLRAEIYEESKDSLMDFQKALQLNPNYVPAFVSRADHYRWILKDYVKAIADMDMAIKINPRPSYYYLRAYIYFDSGDYANAFSDIELAISFNDPDQYRYLDTKAYFHVSLKEFEKALLDYNIMMNIAPVHEKEYCFEKRAKIFYELGDDDKAIEDFKRSTNVKYNQDYRLYCLAIVYASKGEKENAMQYLQMAGNNSEYYRESEKKEVIMALLDGGPRYEFFPDDTEGGVLYDEPKKQSGVLIALGWIGVLANLAVSIWFMRKVTRASARAATAIDLTEVAEVTEVTEIAEVVEVTEAPEVAEVSEATRTMDAKELEQRWAGTMEEAAAHNDPNVGWCRIIEQYRDFSQDQRAMAEPVILKWTISIDLAKRGVALVLVEICGMRTALPQLGRLEAYLTGREGPESRDELKKVRRLIEKLNKMC